jgi:hypothetical protein
MPAMTRRRLGMLDAAEMHVAAVLRETADTGSSRDDVLLEQAHCALQILLGRMCRHDLASVACPTRAAT